MMMGVTLTAFRLLLPGSAVTEARNDSHTVLLLRIRAVGLTRRSICISPALPIPTSCLSAS